MKPPKTPHHRPPPSGPMGRGHVSPLGGQVIKDGGQVLRGGAGGVVVKEPLKYKPRQEPVTGKKGNTVGLV